MKPSASAITVIVPALNEARFLPHLLEDLSQQTYRDFSVILVDGHSTDQTVPKAETFISKLPRFTILTSPKRNVSYQRNLGAQKAQSPWILFMDADNRLPPFFLQGIKYRLDVSSPDVFSTYLMPDSHDSKDQAIARMINLYLDLQQSTPKCSGMESMLGFKTTVFHKVHGFDESYKWGEGGDICRRCYQKHFTFKLFRDPKYTYSFRRLRQEGTLKLARNLAALEFSRLTNIKMSPQKVASIYPMHGGQQFDQAANASPVERILKDVTQLRSLPKRLFDSDPTVNPSKSILSKLTHLLNGDDK